jgi:Reverse transcriptase (RNA-dependent DNA polymerase)
VIAKRVYYDITTYSLIPTNQFGGRDASSTTDTSLTLTHDITAAWNNNLMCAALLFDIQGFLNNINHCHLIQIFHSLGFPLELTAWLTSFLSDHSVKLHFNKFTTDPISIMVGAPQGSPILPVLSIIYTFPLLLKMRNWFNTSLSMYVDDSLIFACSASYDTVDCCLHSAYVECEEWLTHLGLGIKPNKTELIYFAKLCSTADCPTYIYLPLLSHSTYFRVNATNCIHYLGFHINFKLQWKQHISIIANWVKSSLKSLQLLSNSV